MSDVSLKRVKRGMEVEVDGPPTSFQGVNGVEVKEGMGAIYIHPELRSP
jgi:hypothetical protein